MEQMQPITSLAGHRPDRRTLRKSTAVSVSAFQVAGMGSLLCLTKTRVQAAAITMMPNTDAALAGFAGMQVFYVAHIEARARSRAGLCGCNEL